MSRDDEHDHFYCILAEHTASLSRRHDDRGTDVRFAMTAMAGISGLLLLGLGMLGQPAVYLHQARDEWNALIDAPADGPPATPADRPPAAPERDAAAARVALLQKQVKSLRDELRARQALALQASQSQPAPPPPAAVPPPQQTVVPPPQTEAVAQPRAASPRSEAPQPPHAQPAAPKAQAAAPEAAPEAAQLPAKTATAEAAPQANAIPERHEAAAPAPAQTVTGTVSERSARPSEAASEAPRPPPRNLAAARLATSPPPPPRENIEDAQSVLARLRQLAPTVVQPADNPPPVEQRPRPVPSPSLPKLAAARAALAGGRIDDARRLLQEAQLQLVFRPVSALGDGPPSAGQGAADVAHALEALSANDVPLSRRYIEVAIGDLSGNATSAPIRESRMRATGYAPAYPPR